jgi:hypothetical protein
VTLQKFEHPLIEYIVFVAGDHVTRAAHVEDFQLRQMGTKIGHRRFRDNVAL